VFDLLLSGIRVSDPQPVSQAINPSPAPQAWVIRTNTLNLATLSSAIGKCSILPIQSCSGFFNVCTLIRFVVKSASFLKTAHILCCGSKLYKTKEG
jgi:hypothetical protein